jgi:predicted Zn-dependent protease
VRNRTSNLESYNDYLRAKALVRARGTSVAQAIGVLEKVVAGDPSFAPAWAMLARAYALAPTYGLVLRDAPVAEARASVKASLDKAEMAASEAIRLDKESAEGYGALAFIRFLRGQWVSAEELHLQALKFDANEPDILQSLSISLAAAGRLTEALALTRNLRALEPFVPIYNLVTAELLQARGQIGDSIPMLEAMPPDVAGGMLRNALLAHAYAAERDYDEAANTLLAIPQQQTQVSRRSVEDAAALLRNASTKTPSPQPLPELEGELKFAYFYAGAPERFLEYAERMIEVQYVVQAQFAYLWQPELGQVRKTERFKTLVRKAGLVDYWRAKGWPEFCHPTTGDDFECS